MTTHACIVNYLHLYQTIQHCLSERNPQHFQKLEPHHLLDTHQIQTSYTSEQIWAAKVTWKKVQ